MQWGFVESLYIFNVRDPSVIPTKVGIHRLAMQSHAVLYPSRMRVGKLRYELHT